MMQEKLKVGAAQIAPRFLDKAGTIRKIGQTLEEAGRLGLDLLVFPETFLSPHPSCPGGWSMDRHLGAKRADQGSRDCDVEFAIREYALENSTFVVSSSWYLPPSDIPPELQDVMKYNLAVGGSCIVNPSGQWVREPVFSQETIVWAEIDQEERGG